jgi:putative flippase GtrA
VENNSKVRVAKQPLLFVFVGIANTLLDFALLNILVHVLSVPLLIGNFISMSCAMMFSYFANRHFVFQNKNKVGATAFKFALATFFSLYILQTLVIYIFSELWTAPSYLVGDILSIIGIKIPDDVLITNVSKILATVFSATFNFIAYKYFVFSHKETHEIKTDTI